jgi:HAD superfamily hydrolase (TIGR01549 family)
MSPPATDMSVPVFDLDGTLLDSDAALLEAFVALGVDPEQVTFGHVVERECGRLGIELSAYLAAYDVTAAQPFAGVEDVLGSLGCWGVCSNKDDSLATAELRRLGWSPATARFAGSFAGPKRLAPVLEDLTLGPERVLFVGDTDHDRRCAADAGVRFVLAGWNPRCRARPGDIVARHPEELLDLL